MKPVSVLSARVGVPTHRILIADDTWETYKRNFDNALPIQTFSGRTSLDDELPALADFLSSMDVGGMLDASGWRNAPSGSKRLAEDSGNRLGGGVDDDSEDDFC